MRAPRQPGLDLLGLMGRVVVHDDMDIEIVRRLGVDLRWSHIAGQFGSEVKVYSGV